MSLSKFARELSKGVRRTQAIVPSSKTFLAPSSALLKAAPKLLVPSRSSGSVTSAAYSVNPKQTAPGNVGSVGSVAHIVRDIDSWANDASQTIVPKFQTGSNAGWEKEDITIDCQGMNLRQYLVTRPNKRIDDGSESTDSAPGKSSGGSGSAGGAAGGGSVGIEVQEDSDGNHRSSEFIEDASAGFQGAIQQNIDVASNHLAFDKDHPGMKALLEEINHKMATQGVAYLTNTGLKTGEEMKAAIHLWNENSMEYQGGANYRGANKEHPNVYETGAPSDAWIHYHHEMAYVKESMSWIGFCCINGTWDPMKGATYISNQRKVTEDLLSTPFGQKLKEKGVCYVRKLPDRKFFLDNNLDTSIVYNYWQTSFRTEDPDECVKLANAQGLDCEWQDSPIFGRYLVTKYYVDNYEYAPHLDQNVCYASVADDYMWFDKWHGVKSLPHHERPLKLNFGDDSIMTREEKQEFVDVYDRHGFAVPWKQGDVAICCNYQTAHGRPPYYLEKGEKRDLGVVLGATYSRSGQRNDKF